MKIQDLETNPNHLTTLTTTTNCKYNVNRVAASNTIVMFFILIYEYVLFFSGE